MGRRLSVGATPWLGVECAHLQYVPRPGPLRARRKAQHTQRTGPATVDSPVPVAVYYLPAERERSEQTMDLQGIREALQHQPFEPFALRLADGRALDVPHPEMVAVGKRRIIVVSADDSWSVIEPLMVVSLDYNGNQTPPG